MRSYYKNFSLEPKNYRLETTYDFPTYQKHTTYKAFCDDFYDPFLTLLRKTSKTCVTISLKDSFFNFANSLSRRARLKGSLTVKTIFRSGIGNGLLDFCASTIYRYACRPDTPYLRTNCLTSLGMAIPFLNNAIAVLIRGTTSTSGVFVISHKYNTFNVIMSSIISPSFPHAVIPASMVGQNMLKLKVIDCVGGVKLPPCGVPSAVGL
jgi:hypothetical protein